MRDISFSVLGADYRDVNKKSRTTFYW